MIIILWCRLPRNGYLPTVCAELPAHRQLHIIALTADALTGYQNERLASGMNAYVTKPIRVEELVAALQGVKQ